MHCSKDNYVHEFARRWLWIAYLISFQEEVWFFKIIYFTLFLMIMYILINLKEIKPRHHLQLLKTFPKTTPDPSRIRTVMCESGPWPWLLCLLFNFIKIHIKSILSWTPIKKIGTFSMTSLTSSLFYMLSMISSLFSATLAIVIALALLFLLENPVPRLCFVKFSSSILFTNIAWLSEFLILFNFLFVSCTT